MEIAQCVIDPDGKTEINYSIKKKSLHGNLSYNISLYSFKTSESDIFTQTGPAKMMYDIKFDKICMSCLLFRQNSKLYNITTGNCVSQKNIILKKKLIRSLDIYINTIYIYI